MELFMFKSIRGCVSRTRSGYVNLCQKMACIVIAPTKRQAQLMLFLSGAALLICGMYDSAYAQYGGFIPNGSNRAYVVDQTRFEEACKATLGMVEGAFGALVMIAAGVGSILSAAFGQYRASLSLMVVAMGSFVLRSLVSTFFHTENFLPK